MSMTENEAKEYIRSRICNEKGIQRFCRDNCMYGEGKCAFQIAIKALEEIQQYRAIGTVEELEAMKKGTLSAMELVDIWCVLEDLKKYSAIGTVEEFKALKEKERADKAMNNSTWGANKEISVNWQ